MTIREQLQALQDAKLEIKAREQVKGACVEDGDGVLVRAYMDVKVCPTCWNVNAVSARRCVRCHRNHTGVDPMDNEDDYETRL